MWWHLREFIVRYLNVGKAFPTSFIFLTMYWWVFLAPVSVSWCNSKNCYWETVWKCWFILMLCNSLQLLHSLNFLSLVVLSAMYSWLAVRIMFVVSGQRLCYPMTVCCMGEDTAIGAKQRTSQITSREIFQVKKKCTAH